MVKAGLMTYAAASHQGVFKGIWLHFYRAVTSSIFIYTEMLKSPGDETCLSGVNRLVHVIVRHRPERMWTDARQTHDRRTTDARQTYDRRTHNQSNHTPDVAFSDRKCIFQFVWCSGNRPHIDSSHLGRSRSRWVTLVRRSSDQTLVDRWLWLVSEESLCFFPWVLSVCDVVAVPADRAEGWDVSSPPLVKASLNLLRFSGGVRASGEKIKAASHQHVEPLKLHVMETCDCSAALWLTSRRRVSSVCRWIQVLTDMNASVSRRLWSIFFKKLKVSFF